MPDTSPGHLATHLALSGILGLPYLWIKDFSPTSFALVVILVLFGVAQHFGDSVGHGASVDVERVGAAPRWATNYGLGAINMALMAFAVPYILLLMEGRPTGLFHYVDAPRWVTTLSAVVVLDLVRWAFHYAQHHIPFLWRFHRVHHSDVAYDMSNGIRGHPVEPVLSLSARVVAMMVMGFDIVDYVVFDALSSLFILFVHMDVRLPERLDATLRRVVCTPAMHYVHHSSYVRETNSNFGILFSIWDRWFGTYVHESHGGPHAMQVGLESFRSTPEQWMPALLALPMRPLHVPDSEEGKPLVRPPG